MLCLIPASPAHYNEFTGDGAPYALLYQATSYIRRVRAVGSRRDKIIKIRMGFWQQPGFDFLVRHLRKRQPIDS